MNMGMQTGMGLRTFAEASTFAAPICAASYAGNSSAWPLSLLCDTPPGSAQCEKDRVAYKAVNRAECRFGMVGTPLQLLLIVYASEVSSIGKIQCKY